MHAVSRSSQRGIGMSSVIFIILLVTFFMTLLFKLGPLYMNDQTLKSILNSVATEAGDIDGSPHAIMRKIGGHMDINGMNEPKGDAFKVRKIRDRTWEVAVNYERREHLFFNVDAMLTFQHQVEVTTK